MQAFPWAILLEDSPRKHFVFPRSRQSPLENKHKNTLENINALQGFLCLFIIFSLFTRRLLNDSSNTTRSYSTSTFTLRWMYDFGFFICVFCDLLFVLFDISFHNLEFSIFQSQNRTTGANI